MANTSLLNSNSSSVSFSFYECFKSPHVGMVLGFVALSLRIFLGVPAHCWLLWLSFLDGWKIKPTQVFAVNMSLLELIYVVPCVTEFLNILLIFNNTILRLVSSVIFGFTWVGRPLVQICICVELYLAVIFPVMFLKYKALRCRIVVTAVVWLMAAAFSVYQLSMDTWANNIFNVLFIISVIIISFCCVSVLCTLKHSGPGDTQIPIERGRDVGNQQKRNAFKTIFTGLLIILFTYLPQILLSFIDAGQINGELFFCNISPSINSITIFGVMITPLMEIYKKRRMKCFTHQSRIRETL